MSVLKFIGAFFLAIAAWFVAAFLANVLVAFFEFTRPGSGLPFGLGQIAWARDLITSAAVIAVGWGVSRNLSAPYKWGGRAALIIIGVALLALYGFVGALHVYVH